MKCKFFALLLLIAALQSYSQTNKNETTMDTLKRKSNTIVLIHGLFMNNTSWNEWKTYFEEKGYRVYTPAYPGHEGDPAELRKSVPANLSKADFENTVRAIAKFIDSLPEKPIVIGHSMGGLIAMKLVELNKAAAGVSINGAAPKNILPPFKTVKAMFPVINFLKGNSAFEPNKKWFHHAFANTLTSAESDKVFDKFAVAESRNIPRQTLFNSFANIDLKKAHNPLLFIGGEKDNIIPPSLTKKIATSYKDKNSIADYKIFKGKSHFICGEESGREVADYVLNWLDEI